MIVAHYSVWNAVVDNACTLWCSIPVRTYIQLVTFLVPEPRTKAELMAVRATFSGFDPHKLTGVRVTDRKLGHGSYATVLELEYMGLKCAGKKIHELLLEQGDTGYTVRMI